MGWSFECYPSTKKQFVKKILDEYKSNGYQILGSRQTNQGLYAVMVTPKNDKFLMCAMIKMSERCYGIKEMEEEMGPCMNDCPSSLFKLLDPPKNECARKFREECIARDHRVKAKRKWKPQVGEVVDIYGKLYLVRETNVYGRNKFRVRCLSNSVTYTASKTQMTQMTDLKDNDFDTKKEINSETVKDGCIIQF